MLWIGTLSAIISAGMGYLLAVKDGYEGSGVLLHQQFGILTAILSTICLALAIHSRQRKNAGWTIGYRIALFLTVVSLVLTGHFGASLTHGSDFLTEVLPGNSSNSVPDQYDIDLTAFLVDTGEISQEEELKLLTGVRMVFAHSCYRCHGSDKIKGELRLDKREFVFEGGENGAIIEPGNPEESELIRRIMLPGGHDEVMPQKGDLLSEYETDLISLWIKRGAYWPENADELKIFHNAPLAPRYPDWPEDTTRFDNKIDVWVNEYFVKNEIDWPQIVHDRTYLRRIYLDIVGVLPTSEQVLEFVNDNNPLKRKQWARKLLNQNENYSLHWLTFWNDILRNDYTGTGYITGGRYSITDWLYQVLYENKPYHEMVQELLDPTDASKGFIQGIQWRGVVNSSQRIEMQAAQNVAQVMLGLNLKCASCHDSFISDWKLDDAYGFANIFSETTMEINRCDQPTGKMADTKLLWKELGTIDSAGSREERLEELAVKLTDTKNGRLYRTLVNRIWAQLMGRGIVEPVDEMDQKPWSTDLLDWLAINFVGNGFDMKNLIFNIVTSQTYQLPSVALDTPLDFRSEDYQFRGMILRKITAEQFSDIVSQTISPLFQSEDIKFYPTEKADTSFIRASQVANNEFLTALGRPSREVVVTTRSTEPNLLQALELTNGSRLMLALEKAAIDWKNESSSLQSFINHTFEELFGRSPLKEETEVAMLVLGSDPEIEAIQDFYWAMLMHPDFQLIY